MAMAHATAPCAAPIAPQPGGASGGSVPSSSSEQALVQDHFHGHRPLAEAIERFLMHLFACSQDSMAATMDTKSKDSVRLSYFVAYALYRTRLPLAVMYSALCLLKRLKMRFPIARGSSGHRLFIAAFMLSCKMMCDDSYNNKSWAIVAQNLFSLREINQMERELFSYLDFSLDVPRQELALLGVELEAYGAPAVSVSDLKRTRLSAPASPSVPASRSAPKSVHCASGWTMSTTHTRRKSHRRALSLRPDYWANPSSAVAAASTRHYRSESNDGAAHSLPRGVVQHVARGSLPGQRAYAAGTAYPAALVPSARADLTTPPTATWPTLYATTSSSTMSMSTPISSSDSLRPTPSTSFSDLSLQSPAGGMYVPPTLSSYAPVAWEQPRKAPPSYVVNESFRMPPLPSTLRRPSLTALPPASDGSA